MSLLATSCGAVVGSSVSPVGLIAGAAVIVIVTLMKLAGKPSGAKPLSPKRPAKTLEQSDSGELSDAEFQSMIEKAGWSGGYFTKIVGVSFANPDGSSRAKLIAECETFNLLTLQPEPENEYDPNAVAVCRKDGKQIGYLDRHLAKEVSKHLREGTRNYGAIFRRHRFSPKTGNVIGGLIYLVELGE